MGLLGELVWSGRLGGVDDEDIQWSGGRFEFEAELLLDGGEDVWGGGVGRGGCGGIVGCLERRV